MRKLPVPFECGGTTEIETCAKGPVGPAGPADSLRSPRTGFERTEDARKVPGER